ncbi:hypothetical protein PAWBP_6140 [Paulownia witches'-broom phytoplasma]|nr:hypothetical protein PAWBP_6140 [Paulownia witches'-broom phytoplasma]
MKFLEFIFDNPEYFNKLLKKSHNHKNPKKNKLMQKHVSNKTDKIVSYKMVFIKFFILNLFCLLSGLIIYQLLSHYHSALYSFFTNQNNKYKGIYFIFNWL